MIFWGVFLAAGLQGWGVFVPHLALTKNSKCIFLPHQADALWSMTADDEGLRQGCIFNGGKIRKSGSVIRCSWRATRTFSHATGGTSGFCLPPQLALSRWIRLVPLCFRTFKFKTRGPREAHSDLKPGSFLSLTVWAACHFPGTRKIEAFIEYQSAH